jgi:4-phytase/acid phosphatase
LSWAASSHQPNDAPPGGALIFSLWKLTDGQYAVRIQFLVQTLEQMAKVEPLSTKNPPVIANLFVPGCSTSREGYPCSWAGFMQVAKGVIMSEFVER